MRICIVSLVSLCIPHIAFAFLIRVCGSVTEALSCRLTPSLKLAVPPILDIQKPFRFNEAALDAMTYTWVGANIKA